MRVVVPRSAMAYPSSVSLLISSVSDFLAISMRNVGPGGSEVTQPPNLAMSVLSPCHRSARLRLSSALGLEAYGRFRQSVYGFWGLWFLPPSCRPQCTVQGEPSHQCPVSSRGLAPIGGNIDLSRSSPAML